MGRDAHRLAYDYAGKAYLSMATGIQKGNNLGIAEYFLETIKQALFQKAVKYKSNVWHFFPKLKLNYL